MTQSLPALNAPTAYDIAEKSRQTIEWLRLNIKVGYTDERGFAWWDSGLPDGSHYPGAIPADDVIALLDIPLISAMSIAQFVDADGHKQTIIDPDRQQIVRVNGDGDFKVLYVPKKGYQIHGYKAWTIDMISQIVDQSRGELGLSSAGLLRDGGVAFIQARLPQGFSVEGFEYTPYIGVATSADGTLSSTPHTGILADVCDNTLANDLANPHSKVKVKHTKFSQPKISAIRDGLGLIYTAAEKFDVQTRTLMDIDVTNKDFEAWKNEMVPVPEPSAAYRAGRTQNPGRGVTLAVAKRDALDHLWSKDPKVAPYAGTAFGILQLDNTSRTWLRSVQGAAGGRIERNMTNVVKGASETDDQKALDALFKVQERRTKILV